MNEAGEYAIFPLTVFDRLFERTTFVTGWLIEGTIDTAALVSALQRVTEKWRMLSGRLQSTEQNNSVQWFLKIPLGRLPHDYATFSLTTSTSTTPLSKYVKIPIPSVSTSLPLDVFLHPSTPKSYTVWESSNHPLTCWNITYFPAASNGGVDYTCIGFARSHGIFDGGGAALVINALVAELNGRDWEVPPLPQAGLNVNPLDDVLARAAQAIQYSTPADAFPAYTVVGPGGVLKLAASHVKERFWAGADRRIILLPKVVLDTLVEEVRSSLRNGQKTVEHVTTGDVLVAWIFKTVYACKSNMYKKRIKSNQR
ncbi:Acetyltransferase adrJ [Psilocybe cubensis]|uniref:Acetyltransferase adrJ n=2 Tax=Psilocybe cubensis TaxID=181762 RepID=A0ACB8GGJ1_PSICU|nr:Acetyltransferase adrJ [Psilocybe cubensis]KAH9474673.1 Acetyltransferase adrJ [Psilocybe cubensis]